jgi:hypothetical protein
MAWLYAAARPFVNFFQPSFKLKEKRREGAKLIKRYDDPSTPYERALAHPMVAEAVKERLRARYRTLDPVRCWPRSARRRGSSAIASTVVPEACSERLSL